MAVPRVESTTALNKQKISTDNQFSPINTGTSPLKRSNSVPAGNHAPVDPRTLTQAKTEREDHAVQYLAATLTNLAVRQLIEGLFAKGVVSGSYKIDVRTLNQFFQEITEGAQEAARQQIPVSSNL